MRTLALCAITLLAAAAPSLAADKPARAPKEKADGTKPGAKEGKLVGPALKSEDEKTLYALGLLVGRNIQQTFSLKPGEMDLVKRALGDLAAGNKPQVELDQYGPKVQEMAKTRATARAEGEKGKSKDFLEQAAKEPGAEKLAGGIIFKSERPGNGGATPKPTDKVKVNYRGTLTDGTEFDSSYKRNQPAEFPLNGVIKCWTEGLQKMTVGQKARLVCPSDVAYGDQGHPPTIPGGATLVFEVELLEVKQ